MIIKEYEIESEGVGGTSLKGYVTTCYDTLVSLFGKPTYMDADPYAKVNCEWVLDVKYFEEEGMEDYDYDRELVTIYNWKDGHVPLNECQWHVGGKSYIADDLVNLIVGGNIKADYNANSQEIKMSLDYESAKLIAQCTGGKLSADEIINLATYGTTNANDMNPNQGDMFEDACMCGVKDCPDAYAHTTSGY